MDCASPQQALTRLSLTRHNIFFLFILYICDLVFEHWYWFTSCVPLIFTQIFVCVCFFLLYICVQVVRWCGGCRWENWKREFSDSHSQRRERKIVKEILYIFTYRDTVNDGLMSRGQKKISWSPNFRVFAAVETADIRVRLAQIVDWFKS